MVRAARILKHGLTIKLEKFAQLYVGECRGNATEAYKRAHPNSGRIKNAKVKAHKTLHLPGVMDRIQELIAGSAVASIYKLDQAMDEAEVARKWAMGLGQVGAAVAAITLKSKLSGILIERRENTNKTLRDLTDDELEDRTRAAATEAGYVIKKASAKT